MAGLLIDLTEDTFDDAVAEGTVLVDFWATYCQPCLRQTPILEALAEELGDSVKICKVDVMENAALAGRFRITSIPALLLFKDGEVAETMIGFQQADELRKVLTG